VCLNLFGCVTPNKQNSCRVSDQTATTNGTTCSDDDEYGTPVSPLTASRDRTRIQRGLKTLQLILSLTVTNRHSDAVLLPVLLLYRQKKIANALHNVIDLIEHLSTDLAVWNA
jgi:hypothetical protein